MGFSMIDQPIGPRDRLRRATEIAVSRLEKRFNWVEFSCVQWKRVLPRYGNGGPIFLCYQLWEESIA